MSSNGQDQNTNYAQPGEFLSQPQGHQYATQHPLPSQGRPIPPQGQPFTPQSQPGPTQGQHFSPQGQRFSPGGSNVSQASQVPPQQAQYGQNLGQIPQQRFHQQQDPPPGQSMNAASQQFQQQGPTPQHFQQQQQPGPGPQGQGPHGQTQGPQTYVPTGNPTQAPPPQTYVLTGQPLQGQGPQAYAPTGYAGQSAQHDQRPQTEAGSEYSGSEEESEEECSEREDTASQATHQTEQGQQAWHGQHGQSQQHFQSPAQQNPVNQHFPSQYHQNSPQSAPRQGLDPAQAAAIRAQELQAAQANADETLFQQAIQLSLQSDPEAAAALARSAEDADEDLAKHMHFAKLESLEHYVATLRQGGGAPAPQPDLWQQRVPGYAPVQPGAANQPAYQPTPHFRSQAGSVASARTARSVRSGWASPTPRSQTPTPGVSPQEAEQARAWEEGERVRLHNARRQGLSDNDRARYSRSGSQFGKSSVAVDEVGESDVGPEESEAGTVSGKSKGKGKAKWSFKNLGKK